MRLTKREQALVRNRLRDAPTSTLVRIVAGEWLDTKLMVGVADSMVNGDVWADKCTDVRSLAAAELDERIPPTRPE